MESGQSAEAPEALDEERESNKSAEDIEGPQEPKTSQGAARRGDV